MAVALAFAGAAQADTAVVDTRSGLRLRSSSSASSSIRGSYPRGTKVEVLSTSGSWTKVRVRGKTGYMYSKFLKKKPGASSGTETQTQTPTTTAGADYEVRARRGLRMRSRPSIKGKILTNLPNGTKVKALDKSNHPWWKCSAKGKTGYLWNGYLHKLAGADDRSSAGTSRGGTNTSSTNPGSRDAGNGSSSSSGRAGNPTSGGIVNTGNLSGLRPGFRAKVERILRRLQSLGWQPRVAEGRRSVAQQREKVRKGYSKTMNSYHLIGLAADIIDRRYAWNISNTHRFWKDVGRAAAAENLTWGGNWRSFKDVAHVQARSRSAN